VSRVHPENGSRPTATDGAAVRIAFASGKGGTGKTLLATNLAAWLAAGAEAAATDAGRPVTYVDADVEEPNGHLFLHPTDVQEERFGVPHPVVQADRCTHCGACQQACAWHAILSLPTEVLVLSELCHGCGVCELVCPTGAIVEESRPIGSIQRGHAGPLATLAGVLDVGEARATPLVAGVVAAAPTEGTVIVDCPPGTSCAAMASVEGADLVVLVTEPTPFGLHDLDLAVQMCRALGKPVAAVLNRADLGDDAVASYLAAEGVPLVAAVPFDRDIARSYAEGRLAFETSAGLRAALRDIHGFADRAVGDLGGQRAGGRRADGRAS
jgi:MinD superfamily P-loop ATPase